MIVGVSLYACTSILSAKLGVPHVTIGPGDASIELHVLIHAAFISTHCRLRLQYPSKSDAQPSTPARLAHISIISMLLLAINFFLALHVHGRSTCSRAHGR